MTAACFFEVSLKNSLHNVRKRSCFHGVGEPANGIPTVVTAAVVTATVVTAIVVCFPKCVTSSHNSKERSLYSQTISIRTEGRELHGSTPGIAYD